MKKTILILFGITIFSSANNTAIDKCAKTHNNIEDRDRCFIEYLKKILKPYQRDIKLIPILNKVSSTHNRKKRFWQIASLKTEKEANKFITKNIYNLNHFKINYKDITIYNNKKGRLPFKVLCKVDFNSIREETDFINQYHAFIPHSQQRRGTYSNPQPRGGTYSSPQASITHNINTMCTDLEKNYNKFNRPNVEVRIINRAKRELEECRRNRQDLINIQRR